MFNTFNMGVGMSDHGVRRRTRTRRWTLLHANGEPGAYVLGESRSRRRRRGAVVRVAVLVSGGGTNLQAI